jgi:hypothetical protein
MTFKRLLEIAEENCERWNKREPKKETVDTFLLNAIFEEYGGFTLEGKLLKELAAYVLDMKEGRAAPSFIEHLKEYQESLFEDE